MVLKALKDEQLQHNDWPELHALAAIIAIYVGEAVTRRPWRRMSAVTVYNKFLRQVTQLLLSSLGWHHCQALISIRVLVLTRFANLLKASLMPAEKQDERQLQYYACRLSCFSAGI